MTKANKDDLVVKEGDYQRLTALIEKVSTPVAEQLEEELSRADVVPSSQYPQDAVCMGSKVRFVDLATGKENEVTLVYPAEVSVEEMKISVLTPMGAALMGMRVGGVIDWELPSQKKVKIEVLAVTQDL